MGKINVDYDVLNQKGSPAWYSDLFANIPTPGYTGRMFISTDTFAFYRDNGTGWDLTGGPGIGTITGSGVSGQVSFFSGTQVLGGSTNLIWDNTNNRLGIGVASPTVTLEISGSVKATALVKSGGTSAQILLADGTTTPTSTFQAAITLTTTGTTGASTLVGATLNVPTYTFVSSVSALTLGTSGTDLTSTVANSTTTPTITLNVPTASATNRGALSSADWTTFNNKQATITLTTTGTSGAATLVGATLNVPNYTNVGTVTSVAALTLGTSGTDLSSSVANSTSTPVITLNVPTASATNRGALSSADFTTFNNKQATISVTAPVVLTGATISMPAATTSVNGYLTSTDWNTFNNKTSNLGTVTDVVALTIGTSGIDITSTAVTTTTTPVITLNIPTASASNRGALSSTDWTTFNNKQATLSLTTTGTSGVATLVANTLNVPNYGSGAVTGSGTTNTISKFTASNTIGNSLIADDGTYVGINGSVSSHIFQIYSSGFNYARVGLTNSSTGNLASDGLIFQQETTNSIIKNQENGYLAFGVNGAETNLVIAQGGNVGVGTASPSEGLTINGAVIRLEGGVGVTPFAIANNNSNGFRIYDYTAAANRFNILTSGEVLIGDTTGSARLSIKSADAGNVFGARSTNATFGATVGFFGADRNTTNNSFYYIDCYNYGSSTYRFRVADSGAVTSASSITVQSVGVLVTIDDAGKSGYTITNSAAATTYKMIAGIDGTSNTGFSIRNVTAARNELLFNSTGAATFSSSVTTNSNLFVTNGSLNFGGTATFFSTDPAIYRVAGNDLAIAIGSTERLRITSVGILNSTTRANFLGATDNALFSVNSGGTLYTVGFSPTATASSTNTFTITNGTTTWIYTGSGAATWTLPNPSGNNQIYWIKNAGTGAITLTAFSGTNIINNSAASVSTISIAVGATAVIAQDGNVKSYQLQ